MPARPGYNAKLTVSGNEVFYSDISPADVGDSLDVSTTGPKGRKKKRIVGQTALNFDISLIWDPEDNPDADPPDLVASTILEAVRWYGDRDDSRHLWAETLNVVAVKFKGPVGDAIRFDLTLESGHDYEWRG